MKILYIANNNTNDFLSDAVFHGLKSILDIEITELYSLWYMYNNIDKQSLVNKFHGRGFTYYAELPFNQIDNNKVLQQIESRYFDLVVYGNVRRCLNMFDIISKYYSKDKIVLLDGNDEHNQPGIHELLVNKGIYFRRELSIEEHIKYPKVKPISFAFPQNKMQLDIPNKEKVLGHVIPGVANTFIFNDEESYLNDYRSSLFAYTWRKAGWDCLRHYEILGTDCIPIFLDIETCPNTICTTIPKDILKEYYKVSGIYELFEMNKDVIYDDKRCLVINKDLTKINSIEITNDFLDLYMKFLIILKEYNVKNITTIALAKYILNEVNIQNI